MEDLAHALKCKWHSLSNLQSLVLAGRYGNIPEVIKPFESITTDQLQEELQYLLYNYYKQLYRYQRYYTCNLVKEAPRESFSFTTAHGFIIRCAVCYSKRRKKLPEKFFLELTYTTLFVHVCPQYELLGLRSENAESEERLFGQAKRMATQASNRHSDNDL